MKSVITLLLGLLVGAQGPAVGKVDSTVDKKANFSALRTYSWTAGYKAYNPEAHKMIVAAFETEMAALGFTKVPSGADVTLAYYTFTVSKVDFKALDKAEREGRDVPAPTKALGRLAVIMRSAGAHQQIWTASMREYLDQDPAKLNDTIHSVTASLFSTYPGRKPAS
jgi:hypothetical protein